MSSSPLSQEDKRALLAKLLKEKKAKPQNTVPAAANPQGPLPKPSLKEGMAKLQQQHEWLASLEEANPYFRMLEGHPHALTRFQGRDIINFASYNYLGLCGDARVSSAAQEAINTYGTSVSASRIASGERAIHRELEEAFAHFMDMEDALSFVGGFGTNESVIGHIVGPKDLIIHDSLIHRSALDGVHLSGARQLPFQHNDLAALEKYLDQHRTNYEQCLVIVEGLYSMDGDLIDLQKVVELKNKYNALLFVDEAHSIGVIGKTGRGIAEHCDVASSEIDLWMCTLSKTFASCGGIIAGNAEIIRYLRYTTPGFMYSVGISPANAAAALKALEILTEETDRVQRLRENSTTFYRACQEAGFDTGPCQGHAVVPVILGSSEKAMKVSNRIFEDGINAQPILFPAVAEDEARIRFFITADHTQEQLLQTVECLKKYV